MFFNTGQYGLARHRTLFFKQGRQFAIRSALLSVTVTFVFVYKPLGMGEDLDEVMRLLDDVAFAFFVACIFCLHLSVLKPGFLTTRAGKLIRTSRR